MKRVVKKIISLSLATAFCIICTLSVSATQYVEKVVNEDFSLKSECLFLAPGDLDADGSANADDMVSLRKMFLNDNSAKSIYSDVNGDEMVDARDLVRLKKNIANNFEFIDNGVMLLNGNSAYKGDFISVMGTGAEYELEYTYKSNSPIKVKINGLGEEITYESDASADYITVTQTFKTPLKITKSNDIELQIIGVGSIKNFKVTRINMDNEHVENW